MAKILSTCRNAITGKFTGTHGMAATSEYKAWANAIYRCETPSSPHWALYGKRGIRVCTRWRNSFEFFAKDMGRKPSSGHSLDRIDVNGNYEPENCRWATSAQQANNRRDTRRICGLTPKEIEEKTGMPYSTIKNRVQRGWTDDRILNQPRRGYMKISIC